MAAGPYPNPPMNGAGATVRTCLSAPDALEVLRQWRPDALVSDIEVVEESPYPFPFPTQPWNEP